MPLKVVRHPRSKYLYLRGNVRGEDIYETTRTDDPTAAEALRIKRESELLDASVYGAKSVVLFSEAAIKYLEGGGSPRFLGKRHPITGHWSSLVGYFFSIKMMSITQDMLDQAARTLYPTAAAETLNRQVYTPFVAVWNYAAADGLCDVRTWRRPKERKGTRRTVKAKRRGTEPVAYERAGQFLAAMSPAPGIALTILFYTGLRPIELFALTAHDVDPDRRWIVVRSSKNNGEPRGVPMHRCLIPLMRGLKARGGALVRTSKGEPYAIQEESGGQMKSVIAGAARRSGIGDISPYTARHTVSTQLVIAGVHQHTKDQILGHAVTDMSRRYTKVPQQPLIDAINLLPVPPEIAALPWIARPAEFMESAELLPLSEEARAKIGAARARSGGRVRSPATREKIRQKALARWAAKRETEPQK